MSSKFVGLLPANPNTTRGTSTKLSASKGKIVYANGKTIINASPALAYSEHVHPTTVARISPSGFYCASADTSGTVRIWDTVGQDNVLKGEYKVISGPIHDLAWDGESKRIIAVGNGREKFGHAFLMETGSSVGEIMGHSKTGLSGPATGGDDGQVLFYHGAPYKYEKTLKTHTKFVQDVRYAPSGNVFASVGSDSKIFLYDGKTGDVLHEVTDSPHEGSIMACTWSIDSKSFVTSAADCSVKLWDVETRKVVNTWSLGNSIGDQQVGNVWSEENEFVSLSLNGDLNVFDPRTGDKPVRVLVAPQKAITAAVPISSDTFIGGCADGRVFSFDNETKYVEGQGHSNLVVGVAASSKTSTIYSVGYDDHVREIDSSSSLSFIQAATKLNSQPKSVTVAEDDTVFVIEQNGIEAFRSNQKVHETKTSYTPGAVSTSGALVAVGDDRKVRLYDWDGKVLKEAGVLEGNTSTISALSFSPDGKLIASGDSTGRIALFSATEKKLVTMRWSFHSARINSFAWTADSLHCASGSLDTHICIFSVVKPLKNIPIRNAGPGGINVVLWLGESTGKSGKLASAGADGCVRTWEVTFHNIVPA
ncbi:WD40-repeat-containing domain protein [Amanita rubescens]|nr:WD40-repeat-containing domain protein [Amanita rubescens]